MVHYYILIRIYLDTYVTKEGLRFALHK